MSKHLSEEILISVVKQSSSFAEVCKRLGYAQRRNNVVNAIRKYDIDTSHFKGQGWNKNNFIYSRFRRGVVIKSSNCIKALTAKRGHRCQKCGRITWCGEPISLEVHHIDGDRLNNEESNLLLLCPNCHSQTDNYRGKNINPSKEIPEEIFVEALKTSPNIRQALLLLGLTAKGGNYNRARELIIKYNIEHLLES